MFLLKYWISGYYIILFILVITKLLTYIIDYQIVVIFCHVLRIKYFKKFAKDHQLDAAVTTTLQECKLCRDTAYLVIQQKDLVDLVKRCKAEKLQIGQDVGLIAYNDTPLYEIIENGITAISTDFAAMGHKAAEFVKTRQKVFEVIPARMIVRNSL